MATEEMKHDTPEAAKKRYEEKKETTIEHEHHERLTYLEGQLSSIHAELRGMEAREAIRKDKQRVLSYLLAGVCYGLLLSLILDM